MATKLDQLKAAFEQKIAPTEPTDPNYIEGDFFGWFEFDAKVIGEEKAQTTTVKMKLTEEVFSSCYYGCRSIKFEKGKAAILEFDLQGDWERQGLINELEKLIKLLKRKG